MVVEEFTMVYAKKERPSIPLDFLRNASLLQTLFSIRSDRPLVEFID